MARYTVESPEGKRITFDWNDPNPPTDTDMDEIFAASQSQQPMSWGETGSSALQNIGPSAIDYGKNIVQGVVGLSPIGYTGERGVYSPLKETAAGLGKLSSGAVQPLIPEQENKYQEALKNFSQGNYALGISQLIIPKSEENRKYAAALGDYFQQRYGGVENIKKTIAQDPVGFLSDASTFLAGAGAVAKTGQLKRLGHGLSLTSQAVEPLSLATKPMKAISKGLGASKLPEKMYRSSVKPGKTSKKWYETKQAELKTGLAEGIMPTESGLGQLNKRIAGIEDIKDIAVEEKIAQAPLTLIKTEDIAKQVDDVLKQYSRTGGKTAFPAKSREIIINATKEFTDEWGDFMTLPEARSAAKGLNKQLTGKFGPVPIPNEIVDTYKALRGGLTDAVYDALLDTHPELRDLSRRESHLIGLRSTIEAAAERIGKRDLMGLGLPIKTGVASGIGSVTGTPAIGATVGVVAGILDIPTVKAKLAIALNRAKSKSILQSKQAKYRNMAFQLGRTGELIENERSR